MIPPAHAEDAHRLEELATECSLDYEGGPGMGGSGPFGESSGGSTPRVVDGQLTVRSMSQLTLAFDHRICDGGTAGGFLRFIADCVESPSPPSATCDSSTHLAGGDSPAPARAQTPGLRHAVETGCRATIPSPT